MSLCECLSIFVGSHLIECEIKETSICIRSEPMDIGWLRSVGSLKVYVSFAKETSISIRSE